MFWWRHEQTSWRHWQRVDAESVRWWLRCQPLDVRVIINWHSPDTEVPVGDVQLTIMTADDDDTWIISVMLMTTSSGLSVSVLYRRIVEDLLQTTYMMLSRYVTPVTLSTTYNIYTARLVVNIRMSVSDTSNNIYKTTNKLSFKFACKPELTMGQVTQGLYFHDHVYHCNSLTHPLIVVTVGIVSSSSLSS